MKKRLHITAILTSPIIALYGVSPFYIFEKIDLASSLFIVVGTTISVYIVWLIHFLFERIFPNQNKIVRFFATYAVNISLRLIFVFANPSYLSADKYHAFPIITSLVLNAIIMIIMDSIIKEFKNAEVESQLQELKFQNVESQKQVLMQQLQPHFLFNTLSTLKSLIKDNPSLAEAYTVKLSDFLRYTIVSPNQQLVTVEKEIQFVNDYIGLQNVRFENALEFTIKISDEILNRKVPVLSLQILVENIFKHNQFTERKPLRFSISSFNDDIIVWNEKSAPPFTVKGNTGLSNLNARYLLICNKGIDIMESNTEFKVTLSTINS